MNIIVADEAGLIDNQGFETSVSPFTSTSGGSLICYGIPCHISTSLLFQNYLNPTVKKHIFDWEYIYKTRLLTDVSMAEVYKNDFKKKSEGNEKSSYIRWNYFCDFEDSDGKFVTRKLLEENNVLSEETNVPKTSKDNWIVLATDVSPKFDYFSITVGETSFDEFGESTNKVCYMKTLNKEREHKNMKDKCSEIVTLCKKFNADILIVDSTSQQLYFIQELNDTLKNQECKTQLFPYNFAGANKEKLFIYLEHKMYDLKLKLLREDESWESEKLIEEMLYFKKEKRETKIYYGAPDGSKGNFSDDHICSVALFNIGYQYAYESSNDKREFDDGLHIWRPKLQKYISQEIKKDVKKQKYYMIV